MCFTVDFEIVLQKKKNSMVIIVGVECPNEKEDTPEVTILVPEGQPQDQEMEEDNKDRDPTRSEGIIEYKIAEFSKIEGKLLSPPIYVRDLPWLDTFSGCKHLKLLCVYS